MQQTRLSFELGYPIPLIAQIVIRLPAHAYVCISLPKKAKFQGLSFTWIPARN